MTDYEQYKQWLADLKPGDEVAQPIFRNFGGAPYRFFTVERRTKTQIVMTGGGRFRTKDGESAGGRNGWNVVHGIRPITAEIVAEMKAHRQQQARRNVIRAMRDLTNDQIDKAAITDEELATMKRIIERAEEAKQ